MSLEAHELGFSYPCGRELYRGLSLVVEPGERVALTAPSGAGKTTLCRLLSGHLVPTAGEVLVDGEPLGRLGGRLGGRGVGALPVQLLWQHPEQAFDPRVRLGESLAEVLPGSGGGVPRRGGLFGRGVRSRRQPDAELLDAFGIREAWLSRLPHELSGGELMRCAMARALSVRPRYLIADEATAMLDAVTQAELWHTLLNLQRRDGWGLVLVTHSPELLSRVATRTINLAER